MVYPDWTNGNEHRGLEIISRSVEKIVERRRVMAARKLQDGAPPQCSIDSGCDLNGVSSEGAGCTEWSDALTCIDTAGHCGAEDLAMIELMKQVACGEIDIGDMTGGDMTGGDMTGGDMDSYSSDGGSEGGENG